MLLRQVQQPNGALGQQAASLASERTPAPSEATGSEAMADIEVCRKLLASPLSQCYLHCHECSYFSCYATDSWTASGDAACAHASQGLAVTRAFDVQLGSIKEEDSVAEQQGTDEQQADNVYVEEPALEGQEGYEIEQAEHELEEDYGEEYKEEAQHDADFQNDTYGDMPTEGDINDGAPLSPLSYTLQ